MEWLPLTLTVWSKSYVRRGPVGAPLAFEATIRRNAPSDATFTIADDHPRVNDLVTAGARVVVEYQHTPGAGVMGLVSGTVHETTGTTGQTGTRTFQLRDDFEDVFADTLGYPVPGAALTAQNTPFHIVSGPAETVLKTVVSANMAREGKSLSVPATAGRGSTIAVALRMDKLGDKLFPAVTRAGLVVRVLQSGATRTLTVTTPVLRTRVLTEDSGILAPGGTWTITPPTVTRVITSPSTGEGVSRIFRQFVNTEAEAAYGVRRSAFLEVSGDDAELETLMAQEAGDLLNDSDERVSVDVQLAETDAWRYGLTFNLGDRVTVQPSGAPALTDEVTEVAFVWTADNGLVITPSVGTTEGYGQSLIRVVAALAKQVRTSQRNR